MPLHKSSRAPRLDPTMISAPLGDFRHTMHIGRGGDAFGDTSFLSTHGPSPTSSDLGAPRMVPDGDDSQMPISPTETLTDSLESLPNNELQHYESVSSLTLDLDLGPSILGDVLGVMDGLGLDSEWTNTTDDKVCSPNSSDTTVEKKQGNMMSEEVFLSVQNNLNGKKMSGMEGIWTGDKEEGWITAENGIKSKGSRPKVRFSDKREEIIQQPSEEEEGQAFDFQEGDELVCHRPMEGQCERNTYLAGDHKGMLNNSKGDMPPSSTSSHSSEYEEITPLDRRGVDNCHSETDSEEEEAGHSGRGYTFEDEFDDEIGL